VEREWENEAYNSVHYFADSEVFKIKLTVLNMTRRMLVCHLSYVRNSGDNYSQKSGEGLRLCKERHRGHAKLRNTYMD
jgi:hypothetical protein